MMTSIVALYVQGYFLQKDAWFLKTARIQAVVYTLESYRLLTHSGTTSCALFQAPLFPYHKFVCIKAV